MKLAVFPLVVALSGAVLPGSAHGVTFVDAFAPVEQDCADCTFFFFGNFLLAQTFTVATDGKLEGVILPLSCTGGKLLVAITDSNAQGPVQNVLSWTYMDTAKLAQSPRLTLVRLPRVQVTAGRNLAIVLGNPEGHCGVTWAHTLTFPPVEGGLQRTDAYPNGHLYWLAADGNWRPVNNGLSGGPVDDMGFEVLLSSPGSDEE
ncbi:MAG TPA: hypothetical protein VFP44_04555 [Usitatibacter sp.]|nr:hypothetical protein [Usitatibacter sp.]